MRRLFRDYRPADNSLFDVYRDAEADQLVVGLRVDTAKGLIAIDRRMSGAEAAELARVLADEYLCDPNVTRPTDENAQPTEIKQ